MISTRPIRLAIALLAPAVFAWSASAFAANCTNGKALYEKRIGQTVVGCANGSCHGANPAANLNNIQLGGASPANIEAALASVDDMAGLGDPGGVYGPAGLTPQNIADIADWIFFAPTCPSGGAANVSAAPNPVAFGSVNVGGSSQRVVTISNTGSGAATAMVYGGAPIGYSHNHNCPASLPAGGSCTMTVTFSPTAAQSYNGNISITGGGGISVSVALSGTGTGAAAPNVGASPGSLSFGTITVGASSGGQTVTLTNTGGASATGMTYGAAPAGFTRTAITCGATIAAGGSCTMTFTFSPTAAQAYGGSIAVTGSGTNLSIGLSGTGSATAAPNVNSSASLLSFGNVTVGQTSATQTITVTNNGTAAANDMAYPAAPAKFNKSGTCAGATLAPSASCTIVFSYSPTAVMADNATYTFTGGGKSFPIALSGAGVTGTPPAGQLSMPSTLSMPATTVGTSSAPQTVTISNLGTSAVTVTSITSSNSGEFAVGGSTCASVGAGGGCTFNVTFTPATAGARSASITIVSSGTGSPQSILVNGTGNPAGGGGGGTAIAIEYWHAAFDHYFVTAIEDEITKLDNGTFVGWTRTGKQFKVYTAAGAGLSGVCRFFSTTFDPKSSHFYTADANECTVVKANKDWTFEAVVFYVPLPTVFGSCPIGTMPVFRLYNNGQGGAPNHRLTVDAAVRSEMMERPDPMKWVPEGLGVGVTMCSPP